jgi:acetyl esterase/lipase
MRAHPSLACALFSVLLIKPMTTSAVEIMPLDAGTVIKPMPSDYDPQNPDQDRFATGSEVETPALTYFAAPPGKRPAASVIICPGGGYGGQAVDKEGYKPALWLNSLGISAFVLRYRLPHGEAGKGLVPPSLEDLQRAILIVRENAYKWRLDPTQVGIMGWSAGGHLAATAATHFHPANWAELDPRGVGDRPDFLILIYPVITMRKWTHGGTHNNLLGEDPGEAAVKLYSAEEQVTTRTPPTFIAVASDDDVVPVENSILFANALKAAHVPCDIVIYEHGGHGFGMGVKGKDSAQWPDAFEAWAGRQGLLRSPVQQLQ